MDPDYLCPKCYDQARPIDNRSVTKVDVDVDVEPNFCCLGDTLCAGGGCKLAIISKCGYVWGKFTRILPILTSKHVSLRTRGKVFNTCVRSALLHGSETLAPAAPDLKRLHRKVRWICGVRGDDEVPPYILYAMLGVRAGGECIGTRRLRWFWTCVRSSSSTNSITCMTIPSARRRGKN